MQPGALGVHGGAGGGPDQAPADHREDPDDEAVGRDREGEAGLPDAAQVQCGQHPDHDQRDDLLVPADAAQGRRRVGDTGGDRHCDGHHVVDEQRARHRHAEPRTEVRGGDLVVAAAAGIGVHGLPVRRDDGDHDRRDGEPDPRCVGVRRDAGEAQGEEDLLRGVGHRRQRVTGEDRQRHALGHQRLAEPLTAHGPADDQPLGDVREPGHADSLVSRRAHLDRVDPRAGAV